MTFNFISIELKQFFKGKTNLNENGELFEYVYLQISH